MSSNIEKIKSLGEVRHGDEWQNYRELGLNEDDVPALLKIIEDTRNDWTALHAWRALGQIKSPKAIEPLLKHFSYLSDDDWAISELSVVMGMIGEEAIEPLARYMNDKRYKEFARVMAMDGLAEIVIHHPETRQWVLDKYKQYISKPDKKADSLNGLLIGRLIDLKAKEMIDDIALLFETADVDLQMNGDFEDVEIELGLRDKRDTPKPDYHALEQRKYIESNQAQLKNLPDLDELDEYEQIDNMLLAYENDDSVLSASELDGFFTAILCAPSLIEPSQWMLAIWGGKEMPEFESIEVVQKQMNLFMWHYNQVLSGLQNGKCEPLFLEYQVEGKTYPVLDDWCDGFWRGYKLWISPDYKDDKLLQELLELVIPFAVEEGGKMKEMMTDSILRNYMDSIPLKVNQLFRQNDRRYKQEQTFIHEQPKVGRNDPCPCGSGKKYKKCCLH